MSGSSSAGWGSSSGPGSGSASGGYGGGGYSGTGSGSSSGSGSGSHPLFRFRRATRGDFPASETLSFLKTKYLFKDDIYVSNDTAVYLVSPRGSPAFEVVLKARFFFFFLFFVV